MVVLYRDGIGVVREELDWSNADMRIIDFCDGHAYFTSGDVNKDGNYIERKIPVGNLIRIEY